MAEFDIRFVSPGSSPSIEEGQLRIGSFTETFESALDFWKRSDYQRHWRLALSEITQGATTSALITSMVDPQQGNFLVWWPLYRFDQRVFIQNQLLFLNQLSQPFDPTAVQAAVRQRETVTEDGDPISEWETSVSAIEAHLSRQ